MLAFRSRLARTEGAAHHSARSSSLAAPPRSSSMKQTYCMSSPAKNGLLATASSLFGALGPVPVDFRRRLRDNGYGTLVMIAGIGLRVKATLKATGQATAREGREGWQGGAERDGGLRFAADAAGRKRDKEVGIPTTQYRAACRRWMAREQDGGERERRRASPVSRGIPRDRPEYDQGCNRGLFRRRQPGGTFEDAAIYAGLAPEDILVYVERGEGRRNRPLSKASTVAAKQAARRNARQADKAIRRPLSQCGDSPRIDCENG